MTDLNEFLGYDPNTGRLYWIKSPSRSCQIGSEAGSVQPNGYRYIQFRGKLYLSHRLIWFLVTGQFPKDEIDHTNGIRDDNRWVNLRAVSHAENNKNKSLPKGSKSGCIGVTWHKSRRKWRAIIKVGGEYKYLGESFNLFEAVALRKAAENFYGFHVNHGRASA